MNEHGKETDTEVTTVGAEVEGGSTPDQKKTRRPNAQTISHPVEIAAALMARMGVVNTKKDELTIAIKGLSDFAQQLVQAYTQQVQMIQQLSNRVKALEAAAGGAAKANGANGAGGHSSGAA